MKAYTTLVKPKLEYSSAMWDPCCKCQIYSNGKKSNAALPVLYYMIILENSVLLVCCPQLTGQPSKIEGKLQALQLQNRCHPPGYLKMSTCHTRSSDCHHFIPPAVKSNMLKYSFFPLIVTDWNSLSSSGYTPNSPILG